MKYFKRSGLYKASNVSFHPEDISAYSYSWWKFVGVVDGKVIFNNYRYSNSTSGHQAKVRRLMRDLGVQIDLEMPIPEGLPGTYHKYGANQKANTLCELIQTAEEYLCEQFLNEKLKAQDRYQKQKEKRAKQKADAIYIATQNAHETPVQYQALRLVK